MSNTYQLKNLITKKKINIAVIGLGYVGLPLAIRLCKKKFTVNGFDDDKNKINYLNKKKSYISTVENREISKFVNRRLFLNKSYKEIKKCDVIILCLPTPLNKYKNPELKFVKNALKNIKSYLRPFQLMILESSTYPGCTREIILPILKKKFVVGKNFFIGYSPEREDPSNNSFHIGNIPKLTSGLTKNCSKITNTFYSNVIKKTVLVKNIETAEFTKIFENLYRSVNIALVNEMKMLCNKLGLDIHEIIKAAKTKPFGYQAFSPGPGVGGHCIPIDPFYLSWLAKKNNMRLNFVNVAAKINEQMPRWIIDKSLKNKKVKKALLIGVAYKKNTDDVRESPALDFINILNKKKIATDYHDPHIKKITSRKLKRSIKSKKLTKNIIKSYDIIYILTDHKNIDYNVIKKFGKNVIDTRNVYKSKFNNILSL